MFVRSTTGTSTIESPAARSSAEATRRDRRALDPEALAKRAVARRMHRFLSLLFAALAASAVGISAGGAGWAWTGLDHDTHLWDWLHLLVLPLVLGLLPIWVKTRVRLARQWQAAFVAGGIGFVALVVAGYTLRWGWTGFPGNTLWDWLELLVLPVSVALLPLWLANERRFGSRHAALGALVAVAFAAVAVCGYVIPWAWTGFRGNTLWDWVNLFLVPFAIPAALTMFDVQSTWKKPVARRGELAGC